MAYSDCFLEALGAWQRGWREDAARRLVVTADLKGAIATSIGLPDAARMADEICYRKRFLVPNNPQSSGDLHPLVIGGRIEEGVASWTTELKYAQDFKDPLRDGTISAIFGHKPTPAEVVLNVKALWILDDFVAAVDVYRTKGGPNSGALQNFKSRQSEVILNAPLLNEEVVGFCGRSSPFDLLCELAGLRTDAQQDEAWHQLVMHSIFPESPVWLSKEAAKRALEATKVKFNSGQSGSSAG
jgi:hypothetical protein